MCRSRPLHHQSSHKTLTHCCFALLHSPVNTQGAVAVRYLDGSYGAGGRFVDEIAPDMQPSFGSVGAAGAFHAPVLLFLCTISEAFIAHYNAPRFWVELKNKTVPRFASVVTSSFGVSAVYYVFVTAFGFMTFGANCDGYILNNYSTREYRIFRLKRND